MRWRKIVGTLMIVAGLGSLGWAVTVWQWQDPFTAVYTKVKQGRLASSYDELVETYRPPDVTAVGVPDATPLPAALAASARAYRQAVRTGGPVGRLKVPRMGLNAIVVEGTDSGTLKSGPGRDPRTFVPGEGELVYIAGHRTTYGAPFAAIDKLKKGDRLTFELPYATFEYEVTGHRIVEADEISVLRSKHEEVLALQACHPRFFATHRWITYAKVVRVTPRTAERPTV